MEGPVAVVGVASMAEVVVVGAVAAPTAEEEGVVAEEEEAPTSSSSFRIVERVTGPHLHLHQDGP